MTSYYICNRQKHCKDSVSCQEQCVRTTEVDYAAQGDDYCLVQVHRLGWIQALLKYKDLDNILLGRQANEPVE